MAFPDKQRFQQFFWTGWEEGSGSFSGAIGKENALGLECLKSSLEIAAGMKMDQWLTQTPFTNIC